MQARPDPPLLRFLSNLLESTAKVIRLAFLIMVIAVAIALVMIGPVAIVYIAFHDAPLGAKIGISIGSGVVTSAGSVYTGHVYKKRHQRRKDRISEKPADGDSSLPGRSG